MTTNPGSNNQEAVVFQLPVYAGNDPSFPEVANINMIMHDFENKHVMLLLDRPLDPSLREVIGSHKDKHQQIADFYQLFSYGVENHLDRQGQWIFVESVHSGLHKLYAFHYDE